MQGTGKLKKLEVILVIRQMPRLSLTSAAQGAAERHAQPRQSRHLSLVIN